ncbi:MAG: hypothetical protein JO230_22260 [Xanthobacteraceae bacterium]|nr:hypothetical protein [Xanthobacteraceae bacterium]
MTGDTGSGVRLISIGLWKVDGATTFRHVSTALTIDACANTTIAALTNQRRM